MKRLLPALLLLINAAPLLANDNGGDGAYIPPYRELVREGYGSHYYDPHNSAGDGYYLRLNFGDYHLAPKPTMAYYGRGYTLYYGYSMVPTVDGRDDSVYAFGYPLSFFRRLMPDNVTATSIANVAVEVRNTSYYAPGDYIAVRSDHSNAISTVQAVPAAAKPAFKTATMPANPTLPPIGEAPLGTIPATH